MRVWPGSEQARIAPQSFSTIPNTTHFHLRSEGGHYPLCAEHLHHLLLLMCGASCKYDAIHRSSMPFCSDKVFVMPYIGVPTGMRPSTLLLGQGGDEFAAEVGDVRDHTAPDHVNMAYW
jgi:hypothetical protein